MPVINFTYDELYKHVGQEIPKDELINMLPMISSDVESYDDENVKVEFFPNRPDYYSIEGVARAIKGYIGLEKGIPEYNVKKTDNIITVDPQLKSIRPYVGCCIVKNISINDELLKNIMDFQENLHWVIGRDRKKIAIGIHDVDKVKSPFYYNAGIPDDVEFIALDSDKLQNLDEILEGHDKGKSYAQLIDCYDKYPLIVDGNGDVMSMPPIINSEKTKLTTDTHNIFIDVTGTDLDAVNNAVNIIATSFAEDGGEIETVTVDYGDEKIVYPDLTPITKIVHLKTAEELIGIDLTSDEIIKMLERVRFNAEKINDDEILVTIPKYRIDILHEVDIIENIAIGYGFNSLPSEFPKVATIAKQDNQREFEDIVSQIMIGLGFTQIMSLMLTNEEAHFTKLRKNIEKDIITVAQPISNDRTMIRKSLVNGLLEFLNNNKHENLPQKIFEVGDTGYLDTSKETGIKNIKKLAAAVVDSTANFTQIKSIVDSFCTNMGFKMEVVNGENSIFIPGRAADFTVKPLDEKLNFSFKGFFGEVNPEVITNFDMEYPIVLFEIEFLL
ncbi:MAG: phenylalanine--tRNA ligase subunit beta [Methanobacteriaceae archaeon]|nr:phenylalanine--tRNA ligase subunit beta [Methanobacteriaceae archaeon]